jgi:hypothetical protein
MQTMISQIVEQTYQAFQDTSNPSASKSDHRLLLTDVASISTKMNTLLQMMTSPTDGVSSPPRAKRQNTTPARTDNVNAQVSQDSDEGAIAMELVVE